MPKDLRSSLSSKLDSFSQHVLGPESLLQNSRMGVSPTPDRTYCLTPSVFFVAWSAPSAIGSAGVGVGGQLGAEMTDFLVVLNSAAVKLFSYSSRIISSGQSSAGSCGFKAHVRCLWLILTCQKSFMSAGSLTLGGNLSIAVGPLGRNGEAIGSLNSSGKVAAMQAIFLSCTWFTFLPFMTGIAIRRPGGSLEACLSKDPLLSSGKTPMLLLITKMLRSRCSLAVLYHAQTGPSPW